MEQIIHYVTKTIVYKGVLRHLLLGALMLLNLCTRHISNYMTNSNIMWHIVANNTPNSGACHIPQEHICIVYLINFLFSLISVHLSPNFTFKHTTTHYKLGSHLHSSAYAICAVTAAYSLEWAVIHILSARKRSLNLLFDTMCFGVPESTSHFSEHSLKASHLCGYKNVCNLPAPTQMQT